MQDLIGYFGSLLTSINSLQITMHGRFSVQFVKVHVAHLPKLLLAGGALCFSMASLGGLKLQADAREVDAQFESATATWQSASFPVENFQAYTSPFGYRGSPYGGGGREFHRGLDMAAPQGSYIRNWWGGKVIEVSDDSSCGTSVVIQSGPWTHIYCHMEGRVATNAQGRYMLDRAGGVVVWEGQQVGTGARIGRVGMTGRTTGPHLHWGLKHNGKWINPALVLRAMFAQQSGVSVSSR
jgi:murein DD-endopeptidase MepM/ murein hydrolase activator NlpD